MKHKSAIYILMLFTFTLVALSALPALVQKATYTPYRYPFMYYSSMLEQLCLIDYPNKEFPMSDKAGNRYNTAEFDSLMPLLNYRQLMSDSRLPDSLKGKEITPPILRTATVNFRLNPSEVNRPDTILHILYEAMPKRVGTLEAPPDVFRLTNKIEFIDIETNSVDLKKSQTYQTALEKVGFTFPARWVSGNPQPRKPYEEGYFCLDTNGKLFHIKMVNNRAFIRDTKLDQVVDIAWFSIYESANKRFYGFLFDTDGNSYIVEDGGGKYDLLKMDIEPIDITKDRFGLMGNLLYWTVTINRPDGMDAYGLDTETLTRLDEYHMELQTGLWDQVSAFAFPWYITVNNPDSKYSFPVFHWSGWIGFAISLLLAAIYMGVTGRKKRKGILYAGYIFLTGITGWVVLALLPDIDER